MSDQEIASTSVTSVSQQAESSSRVASEKKPAAEEPKKVEAPTPAESVAQSSVRVSNAVNVTSESISPERMAELISELEAKLPTTASKGLQFTMDEVLHRPIVSVVDKESGKVLRQLPAEEVVRAARNIEYMRGILFDDWS